MTNQSDAREQAAVSPRLEKLLAEGALPKVAVEAMREAELALVERQPQRDSSPSLPERRRLVLLLDFLRRRDAFAIEGAQQLQALHVGQLLVEDHQAELAMAQDNQRVGPGPAHGHVVPGPLQVAEPLWPLAV